MTLFCISWNKSMSVRFSWGMQVGMSVLHATKSTWRRTARQLQQDWNTSRWDWDKWVIMVQDLLVLATLGADCKLPDWPSRYVLPWALQVCVTQGTLHCWVIGLKPETCLPMPLDYQRHGMSGWSDYDRVFHLQVALVKWNELHPGIQAAIGGTQFGPVSFCRGQLQYEWLHGPGSNTARMVELEASLSRSLGASGNEGTAGCVPSALSC